MSSPFKALYDEFLEALEVNDLEIPLTAVTFFAEGQTIPRGVLDHRIKDLTLTVCQATRKASLGDAVCITRENIGCVAGAISLGLVAAHDPLPLKGSRIYTDLMKTRSEDQNSFYPPAPKDFTDGTVYACRDAGRPEFSLFGPEDSGRFETIQTARQAVKAMAMIQPPNIRAVFFSSLSSTDNRIIPDLVVLNVRPVELTRLIQGVQYGTGQPIQASLGGLRGVCSDLLARPFLSGQINISSYCLGARLIARYEAERMGMAMPLDVFKTLVVGLKKSRTGFPLSLYPGI
jgi:uncharacterized protein (DUF169 family)